MNTKAVVLLVIGAASLVILLTTFTGKDTRPPLAIATKGVPAPVFTVSDSSGKPVSLADLRGSVVFLNFWASWCAPCREEMPSIQALYNRFKDEKGFRIVTVLYKENYPKAMAYLSENSYVFPVYTDNGTSAARSYGVTGVPETYVVDKKGVLREKVIGPADWSSPQAMSLIANLLKE